uniref:Calmodulin n=1 Tax=Hemiselmis andersenii TaxID=464988 RepID=A0A6T8PJA8_HEMAN|mmetsp:Transcript_33048/g.77307  ORF Transcript_33048/g.77307 Transcript_33048/m.77307 type:complete len:839 (-) Transcript_33048:59-2575(-)
MAMTASSPMSKGMINRMIQQTNFGRAELEALYATYKRKAHDLSTGGLSRAEFEEVLVSHGLTDPAFIEGAFAASDKDQNGVVDFKELCTTLSVLLKGTTQEMAQFEFNVWDSDKDGKLTKDEFLQFWRNAKSLSFDGELPGGELDEAEEAFRLVDKGGKGYILPQEFRLAIENREFKLGDPFYNFIHDPFNHKASNGMIAGFTPDERALLHLMGEIVKCPKDRAIPHAFQDLVYNMVDCFYLLIEGSAEVKYEGSDTPHTVEPGMDGFLFDETVFISGLQTHATKSARSLTDCTLIRIASPDFMQAYLQDAGGAVALFQRLKARMQHSLEHEETIAKGGHEGMATFVDSKKRLLSGSDKVLTTQNINKSLVDMQYAVRGLVPITAERIQQEINQGKGQSKPFDEVLYCNIGNPHSVGQKPITFYREVLALVDCPTLMDKPGVEAVFPPDVIARAKEIKSAIPSGTGAYSHSQGIASIRANVAKFIEKRDGGHPCNPGDLFLTNGASTGIQMMLSTLIAGPTDAVLIPIPQYPIYSALIKLLNGQQVGYQMDESKGWSLDMDELKAQVAATRARGHTPKALVIINPGNPVGNCLSYDNIAELVRLCKAEKLVLLADEVYQENVYMERPFVSVKKVVRDLGDDYKGFELVSFHSTSKGIIGECGRRGGYMELCGFDAEVQAQIYKLASSGLCSNLDGQVMVDLMVKGPAEGDASHKLFVEETSGIFQALKRKSQMLYKALNEVEGITCQPLQGAMYAFPSIKLTQRAVDAAKKLGHAPDTFYALSLLEQTGICAVPGSGFGQKEGTHHIRLTFLPSEGKLTAALDRFRAHHASFMDKYKD